MKSIGLVVPAGRGDALRHAAEAVRVLHIAGMNVYTEPWSAEVLPGTIPFEDMPLDALVSLGGDGTLLRSAGYAAQWDTPLLGVNLGHMGFLAEIEPAMLTEALEAMLAGKYKEEIRALLDVSVAGGEHWTAMNDAVLTRGGYARLITVRVLVDGEEAGCYRADGLIVATPTGSTGYSLSAGGPIVSPQVDCTVITPVCAHSLQHRPEVVPGGAKILLELGADEEMTASLQVDGQNCAQLQSGARIEISKSQYRVRLIRMNEPRFFQVVRHKLAEWSS